MGRPQSKIKAAWSVRQCRTIVPIVVAYIIRLPSGLVPVEATIGSYSQSSSLVLSVQLVRAEAAFAPPTHAK